MFESAFIRHAFMDAAESCNVIADICTVLYAFVPTVLYRIAPLHQVVSIGFERLIRPQRLAGDELLKRPIRTFRD